MTIRIPADLTYHVAPEHQGQIVEIAYAVDGESERLVRRTTDRSDGTVSYAVAPLAEVEGEIEPWNVAPAVADDAAWKEVR